MFERCFTSQQLSGSFLLKAIHVYFNEAISTYNAMLMSLVHLIIVLILLSIYQIKTVHKNNSALISEVLLSKEFNSQMRSTL